MASFFRFSFPYREDSPQRYDELVASYYKFTLRDDGAGALVVGWLLPSTVERMKWTSHFEIDHEQKTVSPITNNESQMSINQILADQLNQAREDGTFKVLKGWRDELYPILREKKGLCMERSGTALFGVVTLGVHMTAYTRINDELMIWVPRRARSKQTYSGMLDNTVAGGISEGEPVLTALLRESEEEASLPNELVRERAVACGTVSYLHFRDEKAGGETGLLQPEVQYVYDLELPQDVIPKPCDTEVEEFYLWRLEQVLKALREEEFKPNCALVIVDFFVRHGLLTPGTDSGYAELVPRLHRRLPFPVS